MSRRFVSHKKPHFKVALTLNVLAKRLLNWRATDHTKDCNLATFLYCTKSVTGADLQEELRQKRNEQQNCNG